MAEEEKKADEATSNKKEEKEKASSQAVVGVEEAKEEVKESIEEAKEEMADLPEEEKKIIDQIENMTVLRLNNLVKAIEKRFGVSARAAQVAVPGAGEGDSGEEEKNSFTVGLKDVGGQKIAIIKVVKALLGLGLKDAKDLVDGAPAVLKEGVKKEEAEEIKNKVEEAGGSVEIK